jgi:hypothetical protein
MIVSIKYGTLFSLRVQGSDVTTKVPDKDQTKAEPKIMNTTKGNCHRVHQSASHGHANRASRHQKIFSAVAQALPVAVTGCDHKEARPC